MMSFNQIKLNYKNTVESKGLKSQDILNNCEGFLNRIRQFSDIHFFP